MDIKDFEGIYLYKLILPGIYFISWIGMFTGPVYYPVFYEYVNVFFFFYCMIKIISTMISVVNACILHQGVLKRLQKTGVQVDEEKSFLNPSHELMYGFVIPNYKEEEEMLAETLSVLASHPRAKQKYVVLLAMEAHENGSEQKALRLIEKFQGQFRVIAHTLHHIRQYEQKGKASNVSYCVEHLEPILQKNNINGENLFLTIQDADSWVPPIYMDLLEEEIHKNYEERHINIYEPPQIFTRNNLEVPVLVRIYDITHGYYHLGGLTSVFNLSSPLSNYTLSYQLVKRIGYWDTCADAIGEDFHTFQKAFWKTNGEVKAKIIVAPFNQSNIETGKGYLANIKARFWQGERHAQGCADIAYSLNQLIKNPTLWKGYAMFYIVLESFIIPAILPWIYISQFYQKLVLCHFMELEPQHFTWGLNHFMFAFMALSYVSYFFYEYFKRSNNFHLYKNQNQSIFRLLEHLILHILTIFIFSIPNFVIAAFRVLKKDRIYVVADKKAPVK